MKLKNKLLKLNKQTIAHLNANEQNGIKAGVLASRPINGSLENVHDSYCACNFIGTLGCNAEITLYPEDNAVKILR